MTAKLSLFRRIMCRLGFHTVYAEPCVRLITITKHKCACCDKLYVFSNAGEFIEDANGNLS